MGRSFQDWLNSQDPALVAKVRAGDEANKPLLNQINWIWVANLMAQKAEEYGSHDKTFEIPHAGTVGLLPTALV